MLIEMYFGGHSKAMVLAHEGQRATNSDIVHTVPAQIERRRSNKQKWFFGAVEFKFEPNMTVLIKNLAQKVDFWANYRSNQDCRSICASTVYNLTRNESQSQIFFFFLKQHHLCLFDVDILPF